MDQLPEVGSKWFIGGNHFVVVAHGVKEGEPAIACLPLKKKKPLFIWIWRLAGRKAIPSNA